MKNNQVTPSTCKLEELPISIVEHYSRYRNNKVVLRKKKISNTVFEIDSKYEILDLVGQGAYGMVVAAKDRSAPKNQNARLAIKKIERAFEHKVFAKRTLRELKILRLLQHENVVGIKTILLPKSREDFNDIYICLELMETDLSTIIKSSQTLSNDHIRFFMYQILRGLKYLHSAGIVHRDLKPRNLLVNSNCDLKICDFGLARTIHFANTIRGMTNYVATRWYRPPELLLETKEYGPSIDMWSLGCILAELIKRKPFLPGSDTANQLELIFETLGTPSEEEIELIQQPKAKQLLKNIRPKPGKSIESLFPREDPMVIDLLKKLLIFNPNKRISAEDALKHPYFAELHCPEDEPIRDIVPAPEFQYEAHDLSVSQMKDVLYEEILLYHFGDFRKEYFSKVYADENPYEHIIKNENGIHEGR